MKKIIAVIFVFGLTLNVAYSAEPSWWHKMRVRHAQKVEAKRIEKIIPTKTSCTPSEYIDKHCRPIKRKINQ